MQRKLYWLLALVNLGFSAIFACDPSRPATAYAFVGGGAAGSTPSAAGITPTEAEIANNVALVGNFVLQMRQIAEHYRSSSVSTHLYQKLASASLVLQCCLHAALDYDPAGVSHQVTMIQALWVAFYDCLQQDRPAQTAAAHQHLLDDYRCAADAPATGLPPVVLPPLLTLLEQTFLAFAPDEKPALQLRLNRLKEVITTIRCK